MNPVKSEKEEEVNNIKPVNRKSEIVKSENIKSKKAFKIFHDIRFAISDFRVFNTELRTLNFEPPAGQGGVYGK
jgi:hypothetical protein